MSITQKNGKRRTIVAIALGSIAVLGFGAALTTAAWTDDVWFSAEADTASIDLYGAVADTQPALDVTNWEDADTEPDAITIPVDSFGDLMPGETRSVPIWLWNESTTDLSVSLPSLNLTGDPVFDGNVTDPSAPASIGVYTDAAGTTPYTTTTIPANGTVNLYVVVRTPEWVSPADDGMQGVASDGVAIQFGGTTI
ncbi:hypothetical protein WJX64_05230 [Leifsonia sp. YIM 134122]|uniref:Alternate-type signal peptide domain-containing protein n=1 Tax=Leifsonia stereocauli TaxID=3134136 RepID=A0ABU9W446_9MICO